MGAAITAWITSIASRRDHQFQRMLQATDEIRSEIDRAVSLANEYWTKEGGHSECPTLEGQIMACQNRIVSNLAIVKKLDPRRFKELGADLQDDFIDALTGGQFQVRSRSADAASGDRARRFASRLSDKVANCSTTPKATGLFSRS